MSGEARRLLVARAVRAELERSGMTADDLAHRSGISAQRMARLLQGAVGFGVDQLEAVAAALGVDATDLWLGLGS